MGTQSTFQDLAEHVIATILKQSPVRATYSGLSDYDSLLDSADKTAKQKYCSQLTSYLSELERIDLATLSEGERIDRQIMSGQLAAELELEINYRRWDRDPTLPLEAALYGNLMLIMHETEPADARMLNLEKRISQIPKLLSEAKENLALEAEVPTVWAEMAEDLCQSANAFLEMVGKEISKTAANRLGLEAACTYALLAVADYERFLREKLTNRSKGSYAIGQAGFEKLIRSVYGLEQSLDELVKVGEQAMESIQNEATEIAQSIHPSKSVQELLDEMKSVRPSSEDLLEVYRGYVSSTARFLKERDLVSVPDVPLEVVETPEFVRHTYPYAAYSPPAPLEPKRRGQFWVTPIAKGLAADQLVDALRNHNPFQSHVIAIHEGWPGHHLQLTLSSRLESKVRKLFDANVFVEGWALYCEELMWEQGYFSDPHYRLMQLYLELWRACRIVIDIRLHCGDMSFTEAVNLLVEVAKLDKLSAIAEVKRYSQSPTQPLSYLIGKKAIMGLRSECRQQWKDQFSLKRFHDRLLALGSVPLNIARRSLLEQK